MDTFFPITMGYGILESKRTPLPFEQGRCRIDLDEVNKMPSKSLRDLEDKVTIEELLDEYEQNLQFFIRWMRRRRSCTPEEADVVLFTREDLWETMKRQPNGLTGEQRKRLKELDSLLKEHAHLFVKVLGDELPRWRKRFKPPRSHWWWFLDKLVMRQKQRVRQT